MIKTSISILFFRLANIHNVIIQRLKQKKNDNIKTNNVWQTLNLKMVNYELTMNRSQMTWTTSKQSDFIISHNNGVGQPKLANKSKEKVLCKKVLQAN